MRATRPDERKRPGFYSPPPPPAASSARRTRAAPRARHTPSARPFGMSLSRFSWCRMPLPPGTRPSGRTTQSSPFDIRASCAPLEISHHTHAGKMHWRAIRSNRALAGDAEFLGGCHHRFADRRQHVLAQDFAPMRGNAIRVEAGLPAALSSSSPASSTYSRPRLAIG